MSDSHTSETVNKEQAEGAKHSLVLHQFDKGEDVLTADLLPALVWRCANQRREIARLHARRDPPIKSSHVIMVPWCQCCEARVPIDHVCSCELEPE